MTRHPFIAFEDKPLVVHAQPEAHEIEVVESEVEQPAAMIEVLALLELIAVGVVFFLIGMSA